MKVEDRKLDLRQRLRSDGEGGISLPWQLVEIQERRECTFRKLCIGRDCVQMTYLREPDRTKVENLNMREVGNLPGAKFTESFQPTSESASSRNRDTRRNVYQRCWGGGVGW